MSFYPLKLRVVHGEWRLFALRRDDPKFAEFKKRVLRRDNYTCQFCGFQAKDYQEVVNLDHDYHNNKMDNIVTSCLLCAQCLFLDAIGKGEYGGGTLVYLPEFSQNELNAFSHVLFCAMANNTAYKDDAKTIYRTLKLRSKIIEEKLGEGLSDPSMLGQMLIDAYVVGRKQVREKMLADIRLLPSRDRFEEQIKKWANSADVVNPES
ncbi:MAG: type IVB secretion system protein IcmJDotN [Gammaproteobacteria bacterium]|nr:type IVB secretion system protein IcmJDotN [Gammaproteobacteria bacterium]